MPISEELKRIYASAPTDDYYVETMELKHPGFSTGSRFITNLREGFTGKLEDDTVVFFQSAPFTVIQPKSGDQVAVSLNVVIDNADPILMQDLEALSRQPTVPVEIWYRVYLFSDPDTVQNTPLKLDILGVSATNGYVSFTAGLTNLRKMPFPPKLYNLDGFPGLKR